MNKQELKQALALMKEAETKYPNAFSYEYEQGRVEVLYIVKSEEEEYTDPF